MGAAKASYGHSMLRYAVSIRLITPTQAIIYVIGFCTYYTIGLSVELSAGLTQHSEPCCVNVKA